MSDRPRRWGEGPLTPWSLTYHGFIPAEEGRRETLSTLGNGYVATRGALPEAHADGVHYPGTYAAGCYNRLCDTVAGQTTENESLVNLPNWLVLTFRIDGGPWLAPGNAEVLEHRQELDLRRGVLVRVSRFRDAAGRLTRITQRRFVHMDDPHLLGLQTTILAEGWSGTVEVRSALDGTVENAGVERYRKLSGRHLRPLRAEAAGDETVLLAVETSQSHIRVAEAARTQVFLESRHVLPERAVAAEPGWAGHDLSIGIASGQAVTIDKVVAIFTSRDRAICDTDSASLARVARAGSFDDLLVSHARAWHRLWERAHIDIEGSPGTLGVLRLHLFHLLQTASGNSADLDAGVPARGLHGEAYRGHVLWDELFVFPILNLRLPLVARSLLAYRYRRLPEARWAAREAGFAGAMYPWQSASDGREESQRVHLNPDSGRWVADVSYRQRHIGIAVAYNVWQYYQATADTTFFSHYGAEMILEIARFWGSIARYDHARDRYVIRGVMGPDEFHTGYPGAPEQGIDNNAYTNVMVAWVLRRALDTLGILPPQRRAEIAGELSLGPEETGRWEEISRKLYVPFHADGTISQFEGYEDLAEFDWDTYREKYGDIRRLDRILEAEHNSPNRYKASKQADVLMLFYLLSADELAALLADLGYEWDPASIPRTIEYYLSRTSHGSTLSAVVHAWVLARSRRHRALEYLAEALRSDVADIQGGTTAEGIHLAAMAGSFDVVQRCFAGVETRGDTLWLNPYWPAELGTLEFEMRYRGHILTLRVSGTQVRVSAGLGVPAPIRLSCRDAVVLLGPGESADLPCLPEEGRDVPGPPPAGAATAAGGPSPLAVSTPRRGNGSNGKDRAGRGPGSGPDAAGGRP